MFPPFRPDEALTILKDLKYDISEGNVSVSIPDRISSDRKDHKLMLGALLAKNAEGKYFNLVTISGVTQFLTFSENVKNKYIYVEPVVDSKKIEEAIEQNDKEIHRLTEIINSLKDSVAEKENASVRQEISFLNKKRKSLCNESLQKVYELYFFSDASGKKFSLLECTKGEYPPTGTGECCAPKLLHYAFSNNLIPLSMAECVLEKSSEKNEIENIPPCDERCGLILPSMLGIKILYRDDYIIVVDKQSGLLSVPGRGPEKQDCIVNRVKRLFPDCIEQPSVHRLDMETSGLLIFAFTKEAHKKLSRQFEEGLVKKSYIALIDGVLQKKGIPLEGINELYFRLDPDNRPHQIWDSVYGKKAVTAWKILNVEDYISPSGKRRPVTRVQFFPQTGRTHQLRLCASDCHGFGIPIIGDTLYGKCEEGERLMLHAQEIDFIHPVTEEKMHFCCPSPF